MIYIFLAFTMEGVTGSPSYVNHKTKRLKEKGWDVVAFDHYGGLNLSGKIVLEHLVPFQNNRLLELFFPPAYFSKKQREKVLDKLCSTIGKDDYCVVESNSVRLALWGELLAQRIHAKHLILEVGEHLRIKTRKEFDFLNYKFNRNELFTINPKVIQTQFSGYRDVSEEANNHVFSAGMGVVPENIPFPELEGTPDADYKILSFGRYKPYFENMIKGIVDFSNLHKRERINFFIMGDVELPERLLKKLDMVPNLFYKLIPSKRPVPRAVFTHPDVIIATAGCATLSFRQGAKTISMNVENNLPLGVMGYTTIDSVFSSDNVQKKYDVCTLLDEVLVKKMYDGTPSLVKKLSDKGLDYQLKIAESNDCNYWKNIEDVVFDGKLMRIIESVIIKCGFINLLARKNNE